MESEADFDALEMLSGGPPVFERGDHFSDGSVHLGKHVFVQTDTGADPPEETQEEDGDCR
jgi:hypothetical protein